MSLRWRHFCSSALELKMMPSRIWTFFSVLSPGMQTFHCFHFSKPLFVVVEHLNVYEKIRTLICFQENITLLICYRIVTSNVYISFCKEIYQLIEMIESVIQLCLAYISTKAS